VKFTREITNIDVMAAPNQVVLQHYRVLGIDRSPNTGIYMLNEQAVVYFAGNNLVLHNLDTRDQRFLAYTDSERGDARCVAVTPNANMMAFALELDASIIHMVDLQSWSRRPSITLPSGWSPTPFSALAFSANGKFLIAQGASADAILFYFDVQKGALVHSIKVAPATVSAKGAPVVTCISFNPNDAQLMCCTGRGIFRQFTKNDKGLCAKSSSMSGKDSADFRSHIWTLDGRTVIVAMSDGKLSQVDTSSVLIDINITNPTGAVVTQLTPTQKGFACVTGGTRLHFFERSGEKGWQETNTVQVDEKETITAMSLAQADDHITVLQSDSRLLSVPMFHVDPNRQGDQTGNPSEGITTLLPAHHIGPIIGLDVAFRKQLFVTCGEDHAIRVWNYDKMHCEIAKFFAEQPTCISFHPNGGCIVVGFTEKIRYMAITINDIVTQREFPIRGCRECRFSHGGQYFAAVNANTVQIYSSYTFKSLVNLRSPGQRVKTIAWSTDDNVLISCDANGSITLHSVRTGKQKAASNAQSAYFTSLVCVDAVGAKCYGVTLPDNSLRMTEDCATHDQLDVAGVPCHVALGPNSKCLFVSTHNGTILTYCFPGSNFPTAESAVKSTLHHAPITALVVSPDSQFLFTAGEDACVFMMRIVGGESQNVRAAASAIQFNEDVLISRNELVDQLRALRRAQQDVIDLDNEQKYKLESLSQGFKQKRKEIKEKIKEEQASEQANADELLKQITALNEDAEAQRATIETQYRQEMQQKVARFEMNMENEQEQQAMLKQEKEDAAERGRKEYERVVTENNDHTEQVTVEFEQALAALEKERAEVGMEKHGLKQEFNEWEVRIGRELAFEIGKREYEAQLQRRIEQAQTDVLKKKSEDPLEKLCDGSSTVLLLRSDLYFPTISLCEF
jgi:WD40 repeat protein